MQDGMETILEAAIGFTLAALGIILLLVIGVIVTWGFMWFLQFASEVLPWPEMSKRFSG